MASLESRQSGESFMTLNRRMEVEEPTIEALGQGEERSGSPVGGQVVVGAAEGKGGDRREADPWAEDDRDAHPRPA